MKTRIIGAVVAVLLAVAGAIVVVLYVQGADDRAFEDSELTQVYIVSESIPQGTPAEQVAEFLTIEEYPARTLQAGGITDLADLEGLVTAMELLPGDQLVEDRFIDPQLLALQSGVAVPAGLQEVTVALPIQKAAGGAVVAGSFVGVLVSSSAGDLVTTQFVLQRVLVTRVTAGDSYVPEGTDSEATPVTQMMVTLALSTAQVEKVVWAAGLDSLWLTLQPEEVDQTGSRPINRDNVFQ